jgi:hypothetical protein
VIDTVAPALLEPVDTTLGALIDTVPPALLDPVDTTLGALIDTVPPALLDPVDTTLGALIDTVPPALLEPLRNTDGSARGGVDARVDTITRAPNGVFAATVPVRAVEVPHERPFNGAAAPTNGSIPSGDSPAPGPPAQPAPVPASAPTPRPDSSRGDSGGNTLALAALLSSVLLAALLAGRRIPLERARFRSRVPALALRPG